MKLLKQGQAEHVVELGRNLGRLASDHYVIPLYRVRREHYLFHAFNPDSLILSGNHTLSKPVSAPLKVDCYKI